MKRQGGGCGCLTAFVAMWLLVVGMPVLGFFNLGSLGPPRAALAAPPPAPVPSVVKRIGAVLWPLIGRITSTFGWRDSPDREGTDYHTGLDIAADMGTPVKAAADGVVMFTGVNGGYGNLIILRHQGAQGQFETWYGHLSKIEVVKGQRVAQGAEIGLVGSTGRSTGPHLHFEYRVDGQPVDPARILQGEGGP